MSDNWITLIPRDPNFVPTLERIDRAKHRLTQIAPSADEIEVKIHDSPQFFDAGANFSVVNCPSCSSEIPIDWWQDRMDEDFGEDGFLLREYSVPCCNQRHSLNSVRYDWDQGFARFALDVMNPGIGKLDDKDREDLEEILGTTLRVIYQHI